MESLSINYCSLAFLSSLQRKHLLAFLPGPPALLPRSPLSPLPPTSLRIPLEPLHKQVFTFKNLFLHIARVGPKGGGGWLFPRPLHSFKTNCRRSRERGCKRDVCSVGAGVQVNSIRHMDSGRGEHLHSLAWPHLLQFWVSFPFAREITAHIWKQ